MSSKGVLVLVLVEAEEEVVELRVEEEGIVEVRRGEERRGWAGLWLGWDGMGWERMGCGLDGEGGCAVDRGWRDL